MDREELYKRYVVEKQSTYQIANSMNTYANFVRRLLKKYNIPLRDASEAQLAALESGRSEHPTEGKRRSEEVRRTIGEKNYYNYHALPKDEKEKRSQRSKKRWEGMSEHEREDFRARGVEAIRRTSEEGSKLEKFICAGLIQNKYPVDFHKEFDTQHIDIFIPKEVGDFDGVAIEVNGPSHYKDIWGTEIFEKRALADSKKYGLLASKNFLTIVVKNLAGKCSQVKMRFALSEIIDIIELTDEGGINGNYYEVEVVNGKDKKE